MNVNHFEDATVSKCDKTIHFGRLHVIAITHASVPQWDSNFKINFIL
jgi:hypothetical protein